MRIVYLAWHGSVHTRRWVGWFAERGHDVHVVTCGGGDVRDVDADGKPLPLRYHVHELGEPRFGRAGYFLKLRAARRVVRELHPEVVHAHWLTSYGLLALAARGGVVRRRRGPGAGQEPWPLVVTAHGDDVLIAPARRPMRMLVQRVLRAARMVTVPSDVMRRAVLDLLGDSGEPVGGVAAFQYGVETRRLSEVGRRARRDRSSGAGNVHATDDPHDPRAERVLRIVSARALLDLYRIDALLDACAILVERGIAFELELLGDGPARARLEEQAARLGLAGAVHFRGAVPPAQVERSVAEGDVYVSVSESDGVSLALLEALALGAAPVLSDIAANRDWVNDGVTGVLVDIEPAAIADGIQLAASLDRERLAADNLAIVAERADRDTNLAACELLIDSLVGVTWEPTPAAEDAA